MPEKVPSIFRNPLRFNAILLKDRPGLFPAQVSPFSRQHSQENGAEPGKAYYCDLVAP
jgi:hypothetical protein